MNRLVSQNSQSSENLGYKKMKEISTFAVIFSLFFSACRGGNTNDLEKTMLQIKNQSSKNLRNILWNDIMFDKTNNIDNDTIFIGSWRNNDNNLNLTIYKDSFYFACSYMVVFSGTGTYSRNNDTLNLRAYSLGTSMTGTVTLETKDKIFFDYRIQYSPGNMVGSSQYLNRITEPLTPGNSIKKSVNAGNSYIYFTYNSTAYRTQEIIKVNTNEKLDFIFTDYTVVVEVIKPNELKTLGGL
jgi:hypothetical protein